MSEQSEKRSGREDGDASPAVEERIRDIADAYLRRLQAGDAPSLEAVVAEHPEMADELRRRLEVMALLGGQSDDPEATLSTPPTRQDPDRPLPKSLGKFDVRGRLGQGAFGTVYLAWDIELDRAVTLKIPRAGVFSGPEEEARFVREARSAASLAHPGIVQVHDITEFEGVAVIVREYVEGETLEDLIKSEHQLEYTAIAELIASTAEALHYAHGQGVVHRDVKPANIIVDASDRPHVTDFGLARRDRGDPTMTMDGQILGTPAYMSPEQALGRRDLVGPRSDIYSLGVVLYELLTGSRPFTGARSAVIQQVIHDEPRRPRQLDSRTPLDLDTICLTAMEKDLSRRYATAEELAADLRRYLRREPILARPVSSPERLWRWCHRRPALASLSASVIVLLLALIVGSTIAAFYFEDQAARSSRQLVRMHVRAGMRHLDEAEYFDALPYLVEALTAEEDPRRERIHRVRIGTALANSPRLVHLWSFDSAASDAAFTADGQFVALAIVASVRIFDARSGELAGPALEHDGEVREIEFDPDGKLLATASSEATARIWDWRRGKLAAPALLHDDTVSSLDVSSDGGLAVTACRDGTAVVWQMDGGKRLSTLRDDGPLLEARFLPDGHHVLTLSLSGAVSVWNIDSATRQFELSPVTNVSNVEVSPDGELILVVRRNDQARVYDAVTGELVADGLEEDLGAVYATFSPDSKKVAVACWGSHARLFDPRTSKPLSAPLPQGISQSFATFSPDGRRVAVVGANGTAIVWDVRTGQRSLPLFRNDGPIQFVRFGPNAHLFLVVATHGKIALWDTARRQPRLPILRHGGKPEEVAITPDGRHLAVAGSGGRAAIWNLRSGRRVLPLPHHRFVEFIDLSEDGMRVATVGRERVARVWDLTTGELTHEMPLSSRGRVVKFDPRRRSIATGEQDGSVLLWDLESGEPRRMTRFEDAVMAIEFTPSGHRIAAGGLDGSLRVWDTSTLQPVGPLMHNGGRVIELAIDPAGRRLASGAPGIQRVWDCDSGRELARLQGNKLEMRVVRFDPDARRVLTGDAAGVAYVWDWKATAIRSPGSRARARRLTHLGEIFDGSFNARGTLLALCSTDGIARVWDPESGEPVSPAVAHPDRVDALTFSPDGARLVTACFDGIVRTWDLPSATYPEEDLVLLSRVLTGMELNDDHVGGSFVSAESFAESWEKARARLPGEFTIHPEEANSWHRNEYLIAYSEQDWEAVIFHLDRLIDETTDDWRLFNHRGAAKQFLGRFGPAVKDGWKSSELRLRELSRGYRWSRDASDGD